MKYDQFYFNSMKRAELNKLTLEASTFRDKAIKIIDKITPIVLSQNIAMTSKENTLNIVFLSLVISQFDPSIYEQNVKKEFIDKLLKVCMQINADYKDALKLSVASDKLFSILNTNF